MLKSKSIGEKIAQARKNIHLSQAELAQQVAISPQAVGKWERGESLPDITMLSRIAEILGVDLNYFSERFPSVSSEIPGLDTTENRNEAFVESQPKSPGWDLSQQNLADCDFSGLKNLHEKLHATNMQRCLLVGSDLSGLQLKQNRVADSNLSDSDLSNSQIQQSMLSGNSFINCSLKRITLTKSFTECCDFTGADFTDAVFIAGGFGKNLVSNAKWHRTRFKEMVLQEISFEGTMEDCRFENCTFYEVKFQNATLLNTFFRNNKKFKRVLFSNCQVDKLTYAFLKNNQADLSGVSLLG